MLNCRPKIIVYISCIEFLGSCIDIQDTRRFRVSCSELYSTLICSVAITKYFYTKYFTLNTFFWKKSSRTKYIVNFGI